MMFFSRSVYDSMIYDYVYFMIYEFLILYDCYMIFILILYEIYMNFI